MKRTAYIGLGANQGDLVDSLKAAFDSLRSLEQSELAAVSPFYMSAPIEASGPDYLNAVAKLETSLEPYGLLLHLLDIELMLGRKRRGPGAKKNAPRNVDLDLLLLGEMIIQSTPLTLPHPRLHQRAFVLKPLLDLAPEIAIPGQGAASDFLRAVSDQRVELLDETATRDADAG
ncbi:MAG: 2-amino-4-hydroxy-6-hydroxymethyldihydropteridine diphosphokinase [Burkholderiaceae bacterium]|nr:2-amino-4-hydroxy-6-hydroxymethyldihydropteridine diphosphokinase [Burkholderiaceae bacterium]